MVKSLNRGLLRSWWCQEEPSDILQHCRWLTLQHRHETVTWNKNTLLVGEQRSEGSLGSRAVLVGCANKTRWGQWFARAFAAWSLSSAPNKTYARQASVGQEKRRLRHLSFKVPLHCLPASKVAFVPCDSFMQRPVSLRYRCIDQLPRENGSVLCRIALWDCLGSLSRLLPSRRWRWGKTVTKSHSAIRQNTDPVPSETSKRTIFRANDRSVFSQSPPLILKSRGSLGRSCNQEWAWEVAGEGSWTKIRRFLARSTPTQKNSCPQRDL